MQLAVARSVGVVRANRGQYHDEANVWISHLIEGRSCPCLHSRKMVTCRLVSIARLYGKRSSDFEAPSIRRKVVAQRLERIELLARATGHLAAACGVRIIRHRQV